MRLASAARLRGHGAPESCTELSCACREESRREAFLAAAAPSVGDGASAWHTQYGVGRGRILPRRGCWRGALSPWLVPSRRLSWRWRAWQPLLGSRRPRRAGAVRTRQGKRPWLCLTLSGAAAPRRRDVGAARGAELYGVGGFAHVGVPSPGCSLCPIAAGSEQGPGTAALSSLMALASPCRGRWRGWRRSCWPFSPSPLAPSTPRWWTTGISPLLGLHRCRRSPGSGARGPEPHPARMQGFPARHGRSGCTPHAQRCPSCRGALAAKESPQPPLRTPEEGLHWGIPARGPGALCRGAAGGARAGQLSGDAGPRRVSSDPVPHLPQLRAAPAPCALPVPGPRLCQ